MTSLNVAVVAVGVARVFGPQAAKSVTKKTVLVLLNEGRPEGLKNYFLLPEKIS